jgi:hypothetical protein
MIFLVVLIFLLMNTTGENGQIRMYNDTKAPCATILASPPPCTRSCPYICRYMRNAQDPSLWNGASHVACEDSMW